MDTPSQCTRQEYLSKEVISSISYMWKYVFIITFSILAFTVFFYSTNVEYTQFKVISASDTTTQYPQPLLLYNPKECKKNFEVPLSLITYELVTTTTLTTTTTTTTTITTPIIEIDSNSTTTVSQTYANNSYQTTYEWSGNVLNRRNGRINGPSGEETYYNLNMNGVIRIMIKRGIDANYFESIGANREYFESIGVDFDELQASNYYWIRSDGVKMYGPYIMCAADLNIRPKGTILQTSLGWAMVCDTGSFADTNPLQLDIAVAW